MEKVIYYFIEEIDKISGFLSIIGKCGKHLYNNDDCGWWEIKEYGFLEKTKANATAKRYDKTRAYAIHKVVEKTIVFNSLKDKTNFVDRFIAPISMTIYQREVL